MSKYQCLNLILLVMVCICSKKISGHSAKSRNHYDIDEFINQLLSSQKFDELADKVAEKAVKKIKNMNPANISEKTPLTKQIEVKEMERDKSYESHEEDERKKVTNNDSSEAQHRQQNDNQYRDGDARPHKAAPVKINPQALLKNDDNSEQAELSLKYKYLKKHAQEEKTHKNEDNASNEPNPWLHLEQSKTKQNHHELLNDNQELNLSSAEKKINYAKKNKKTSTYNGREGTNGKHEYNNVPSEKEYGPISRPQFKSEKLPRLPVIDIDENGERKDVIKESVEAPKAVKKEVKVGTPRKNPGGIEWKAHYLETEKSDSEEAGRNAQDSGSGSPRYELGELTTTKKVIRKEGDRYYTYLSGPEYAEFHEQLRKEQNKDRAL